MYSGHLALFQAQSYAQFLQVHFQSSQAMQPQVMMLNHRRLDQISHLFIF